MTHVSGCPPLPADSQQNHAESAEEAREDGEVLLHPHHPETGRKPGTESPNLSLQMGGQVIEVKTPLTHRDYSHLVDQEVTIITTTNMFDPSPRTPSTSPSTRSAAASCTTTSTSSLTSTRSLATPGCYCLLVSHGRTEKTSKKYHMRSQMHMWQHNNKGSSVT